MRTVVFILSIAIMTLSSRLQSSAQGFSFSSPSDTKTTLKYDETLARIVASDNFQEFKAYLQKNPSAANRASAKELYQGEYTANAQRLKPLLYQLIDEYLNEKPNRDWIAYLLAIQGSDKYIVYADRTPVYYLLDYIATHTVSQSEKATGLLVLFSQSRDFDMNKPFRNELPPMAYVLRTCYEYLGGRYDKQYLNEDVLKIFIEKGEQVNIYDQMGNNLMAYCMQTNNEDFLQYLATKGINFKKQNKQGQDPMYFAIEQNEVLLIKSILQSGYELSPTKMDEIGLKKIIATRSKAVLDLIADESIKYADDIKNMVAFSQMLPSYKGMILDRIYNKGIKIARNEIQPLNNELEKTNTPFSEQQRQILQSLKLQYINAATGISDLIASLKIYPFAQVLHYKTNYFLTQEETNSLLSDIDTMQILTTVCKQVVAADITAQRNLSVQYQNNYSSCLSMSDDARSQMAVIKFSVSPNVDKNAVMTGLTQLLNSVKATRYSLLGSTSEPIVTAIFCSGYNSGEAVVRCQWYRAGIYDDGDMFAANTGFNAFNRKVSNWLQQYGANQISVNYVGSRYYDHEADKHKREAEQKLCDECEIDKKKSSAPGTEEKWSLFGNYTSDVNGEIIMKNGDKYEWNRTNRGAYYIPGFFSHEEFDTFADMLADMLNQCRIRYCK